MPRASAVRGVRMKLVAVLRSSPLRRPTFPPRRPSIKQIVRAFADIEGLFGGDQMKGSGALTRTQRLAGAL